VRSFGYLGLCQPGGQPTKDGPLRIGETQLLDPLALAALPRRHELLGHPSARQSEPAGQHRSQRVVHRLLSDVAPEDEAVNAQHLQRS
jgi:hypothetical protein